MADTAVDPMHYWCHSSSRLACHAGKSTVNSVRLIWFNILTCNLFLRWLIDTDKDAEGMRVIADLHGGDPEDMLAKAEFQEIKDKVTFEVSHRLFWCVVVLICELL
jgi:hypothetical protein